MFLLKWLLIGFCVMAVLEMKHDFFLLKWFLKGVNVYVIYRFLFLCYNTTQITRVIANVGFVKRGSDA